MFSLLTKLQGCAKYKIWKKWQLFHATDFQSLMYPCFTFCSALGMFPYKINGSTIEMSKLRYILSTIVLCVLCIHGLVVLYMINITGTIKFNGVPKILERNCFYILSSFIAIVTYVLSGPRMHLLQNIMNISSKLSLDSYQKLSRLIHTKDILGSFLLVMLTGYYYFEMNLENWHKVFVPYMIILVFQLDMLYINCVCILKTCFKEINDNLITLRESMVNDEPHSARRIYYENRNSIPLMELKALRKHHLAVSDTVQMLNMIFSLQVLTTVVMTFAEITFQLYFYILHWRIGMTMINLDHQLYDTLLITSITFFGIKIVLIGWACDTGKDQATKIGTTVHEILNCTINNQIRDELQLFSLQVLHCENTFSAKGLIINATLLVAIVGNITTYLLILIQFLIADEACNEKVTNNVTRTI